MIIVRGISLNWGDRSDFIRRIEKLYDSLRTCFLKRHLNETSRIKNKPMRNTIKYFIITLIFFSMSCKKEDNSNFIEKSSFINSDTIKNLKLNRGNLTMRSIRFREYNVYSWCPLIYKDIFPTWIEDQNKPDFSFNEYKFEPNISDIDVPFVIFKRKNENYFFIIKQKDTLKFKIEGD